MRHQIVKPMSWRNIMGRKTRVIYLLGSWWTAQTLNSQFIAKRPPSKLLSHQHCLHHHLLHRIRPRIHHRKYPKLCAAHVQNIHLLLSYTRFNNILNISFTDGYLIFYMVSLYELFLKWKTSHDFGLGNARLIRVKLRRFIHVNRTFLFIEKFFKSTTLLQCRLLLKTCHIT